MTTGTWGTILTFISTQPGQNMNQKQRANSGEATETNVKKRGFMKFYVIWTQTPVKSTEVICLTFTEWRTNNLGFKNKMESFKQIQIEFRMRNSALCRYEFLPVEFVCHFFLLQRRKIYHFSLTFIFPDWVS